MLLLAVQGEITNLEKYLHSVRSVGLGVSIENWGTHNL
jgi:hypothetical protein